MNKRQILAQQEQTEELFYDVFRPLMGWPVKRIRWHYPRIERWDKDANNEPLIPAMIIFRPVFSAQHFTDPVRTAITRQLRELLPSDWEWTWQLSDGWVMAERMSVHITRRISEREYRHLRFASYDRELVTAAEPRPGLWRGLFRGLFKDEW